MSGVLQALSAALVETVAAAEGGVVRVEGRQRLAGSGIVWSAEGVIVTASHVVERQDNLHVGLADGRSVRARLAGRDAATDVAVWKPRSIARTSAIIALGFGPTVR